MFKDMLKALFKLLFMTEFKTRIKILLETMHVLCGRVDSLSLTMSPDPLSRASAFLVWLLYGGQGLEGGICAEGSLRGVSSHALSWGSMLGFP